MSSPSEPSPFRYLQVADQLAQALRDGRHAAGARLPSVRSLCESHAASLATVTHALHRLEDAGLIEARPRQGFFARAVAATAPTARTERPQALDLRRERLMALAASQEDLLSLGHLGLPDDLLPLSTLRRLTQARLRGTSGTSGRSGTPCAWVGGSVAGSASLRAALAARLRQRGCGVGADDLVLTHGEGESLQLCLRELTRPGDRVAVTRPVPLRALDILQSMGLTVEELPAAPDGHEVAAALAELLRADRVAACIADVALSSASGTVWSASACDALVEACASHELPLIECNLLGELPIGTDNPHPLKAFDRDDRVLHCGSLACVTGTGLSVGWIASGRHRLQMRAARAVHGELLPALTDQVLTDFLSGQAVDRHLRRLRRQLGRRVLAWQAAALACFPAGTSVRHGPLGHQLWVTLPDGLSALELLSRARAFAITFVPGPVFTTSSAFDSCLRLTAAHALDDQRAGALRRLGALTASMAG